VEDHHHRLEPRARVPAERLEVGLRPLGLHRQALGRAHHRRRLRLGGVEELAEGDSERRGDLLERRDRRRRLRVLHLRDEAGRETGALRERAQREVLPLAEPSHRHAEVGLD
jgi:hypothetical protein